MVNRHDGCWLIGAMIEMHYGRDCQWAKWSIAMMVDDLNGQWEIYKNQQY